MWMDTGGTVYAGSSSYGTIAKVKAVGNREFLYTWVPNVTGALPTKDLNVLLMGGASASVGNNSSSGGSASGNASASVGGKQGTPGSGVNASSSVQVLKLFRVSKENTTGTATLSAEASADTPGYQGDVHSLERFDTRANLSAFTQVDDRSVTLSRDGAGEWTDYEDGVPVTHGDTTYSYMRPYSSPTPDGPMHYTEVLEKNWQTINASFGGTWQSYRQDYGLSSYGTSYIWSPAGTHWFYTDTSQRSTHLMPTGSLSLDRNGNWQGTSGANSYIDLPITYEITDSDGAVAKAVYKLRVHNPIELLSSETHGITNIVDYFDLNGQPHIDNALTASHSESHSWSISGSIGTEIYGMPLGMEVGTEGSTGDEVSKTLDAYSGQLGPGEYVNAKKELNYNRTHVEFYKYNASGKERRYMSSFPGVPVEAPHEAFWTKFSNWKLSWSSVKNSLLSGYPTAATPQPTLPPPSYKYSKLEENHENPVL